MRRFAVFASLVVVLAGSAVFGHVAFDTAAQDATAAHPIVGSWRFVRDWGEGPAISYGVFHADGTYVQEAFAGGQLNVGAWQPTGERSVDLTFHHLYLCDDKLVEGEARYTFTVAETGDTLDGNGVYVSRYTDDGTIEYYFETKSATGTRVAASPMVTLQTLIRETSTRGTPAP
jgi:hypothetical protein